MTKSLYLSFNADGWCVHTTGLFPEHSNLFERKYRIPEEKFGEVSYRLAVIQKRLNEQDISPAHENTYKLIPDVKEIIQ